MGRSCLDLGYRENISTSLQARSRLDMKYYEKLLCVHMRRKFSRVPSSRLLTGEISMTEIIFVSYEHNFPAKRENFLFTLYKIYVIAGNFTRQARKHFPI